MSYEDAFAAVPGVKVEWCEYFGSYQGRLAAKLTVEGENGPRYVLDNYGSCSGCDSFAAEFSYKEPTAEALESFGRPYVDGAMTLDEVVQQLTPKAGEWYDTEDREVLVKVLADYPDKAHLLTLLPRGEA